jgi:hypothetical protein
MEPHDGAYKLAMIALQISRGAPPTHEHFTEALKVLSKSTAALATSLYDQVFKFHDFASLLAEKTKSEGGEGNRSLGKITTRRGLVEAIHKVFGEMLWKVQRQPMFGGENVRKSLLTIRDSYSFRDPEEIVESGYFTTEELRFFTEKRRPK